MADMEERLRPVERLVRDLRFGEELAGDVAREGGGIGAARRRERAGRDERVAREARRRFAEVERLRADGAERGVRVRAGGERRHRDDAAVAEDGARDRAERGARRERGRTAQEVRVGLGDEFVERLGQLFREARDRDAD